MYLRNIFGIDIERGGIIKIQNGDSYDLYAVKKSDTNKAIVLGKGAFGIVKDLVNLKTREEKVLKVLVNTEHEAAFRTEAENLQKVGMGRSSVLSKRIQPGQDSKGHFCLIMDKVPGQELHKILSNGTLTATERFDISLKIIEALELLHAKGYLHRDIKAENFMYDAETKTVTLVDYGMMRAIHAPFDGIMGTKEYRAPELYKGKNYSTASEAYAVGRLFQDLFGIPTSHDGGQVGCWDSKAVDYQNSGITEIQRNLLVRLANKLLDSDPHKRMTLAQAKQELQQIVIDPLPSEKQKQEEEQTNSINLLKAVQSSSANEVMEIINKAPINLNYCNYSGTGSLPLMEAVKANDISICRILIRNGADINAPDITGFNPLLTAIKSNNKNMVEELIAWGANLNKDCIFLSGLKDKTNGRTHADPLTIAILYGKLDTLNALLSNKPEIQKFHLEWSRWYLAQLQKKQPDDPEYIRYAQIMTRLSQYAKHSLGPKSELAIDFAKTLATINKDRDVANSSDLQQNTTKGIELDSAGYKPMSKNPSSFFNTSSRRSSTSDTSRLNRSSQQSTRENADNPSDLEQQVAHKRGLGRGGYEPMS